MRLTIFNYKTGKIDRIIQHVESMSDTTDDRTTFYVGFKDKFNFVSLNEDQYFMVSEDEYYEN